MGICVSVAFSHRECVAFRQRCNEVCPYSSASNPAIKVSRSTFDRFLGRWRRHCDGCSNSSSASHLFHVEASLRRCLLLLALFSLTFFGVPTTTCPTPQARGDGSSSGRQTGWRRTEFGWEEASRWQLDAPPVRLLTPVVAVHPLVIASLELMISVGALVAGSPSPSSRKKRH